MSTFRNIQKNTLNLLRYNMRIVFGGKFVYFVVAAVLIFLIVATIMAFEETYFSVDEAFGALMFPAMLLVFYPASFGIQNDADQRTLEIIFGIPDYRYKVWLVRLFMILVITFVLLFPIAAIAHFALISIPVFQVVAHLMALAMVIATLGFCISTLVKNGNATAVIMVVIALIHLFMVDAMEESKWYIYLNPYNIPRDMPETVWAETVRFNRIFMVIISTVFLLLGLLNLQNREKFLK